MIISSIICEYNPLHNGHRYQIKKTRELTNCDAIVSIMSGSFMQRGEPALIDKWSRTLMALNAGVDLVLELPALYSLSSAEYFASGAVSILNSTGVIDYLSFGSEHGDVSALHNVASILCKEPDIFKAQLKKYLKSGDDFPTARSKALLDYANYDKSADYSSIIETSNNILGIEYCKALINNNSIIRPFTIKRLGGAYNSLELHNNFSSASAIRHNIKSFNSIDSLKNFMPESSCEILKTLNSENYPFIFPEDMFKYLKYKLITGNSKEMLNILDCNADLLSRILNFLGQSSSMDEFIKRVKTKGYTYTRINRILSQYFIGFEKYDIDSIIKTPVDYIRVLGLNSVGAQVLKNIKEVSSLNIYTKLPRSVSNPLLSMDILSTNAYSILNEKLPFNADYRKSPIII